MENYNDIFGLKVSRTLFDFIETEVLPDLHISSDHFWGGFADYINELAPVNAQLLERRQTIQQLIDEHEKSSPGHHEGIERYRDFLTSIGYIEADGGAVAIATQNVDPEISDVAGPQLVVPISNARYALNAANSRWGSLYDALYGTDALPRVGAVHSGYDPKRGAQVIEWGRAFLDIAAPLAAGSHSDVTGIKISEDGLVFLIDGEGIALQEPEKFVGFAGEMAAPEGIVLRNNGLHIELQIDKTHPVGEMDPAGIADILMESALSTIMDLEDSVAAVDGEDKVGCYRNWLGLMRGDLMDSFEKNGQFVDRVLNQDRHYTKPDGSGLRLHGRSLILVRNVGHLMTTPAILNSQGEEIPEGLMDGMITSLIALLDLTKNGDAPLRNSRAGSIYIVKPKMHGSEEVGFACKSFGRIEALLDLPANTIKIGIMDEERRTSVNLKECIRAAKDRVFFINTGFLDRTGDEIHTSIAAGPVVRKAEMKHTKWIKAYENRNVDIGLVCGFQGKAQIGKGMWAMPDLMADMLQSKIDHPMAGANTAWVPSPTAATLHATHYHRVDIFARQNELKSRGIGSLDQLLTIPLAKDSNWEPAEIQAELDNNAQGILGYVVRWIDQGVGCSKVPDYHNVGLMEDRATLRISSQHMANWLLHGIVSEDQIMQTMKRMAVVVDEQNAADPLYVPMAPAYDGIAFKAACDLVFMGAQQPSGYTEPILHKRRLEKKAAS